MLRKIHLFIQSEVITGIIEKKTVLKDESKIKKKKRKAKKSAKATYTKLKQIDQNTVRNYGLNIQIQSYFLYYQHFSTYYS